MILCAWLGAWLVFGAPVFLHGTHESWLIALAVCALIDVQLALDRKAAA